MMRKIKTQALYWNFVLPLNDLAKLFTSSIKIAPRMGATFIHQHDKLANRNLMII